MIFKEFASMWINMKVETKSKEGYDAQQFKFKPRAFEIKHVIDVDISTFSDVFATENFSEWQDLLSEDECFEKVMILRCYILSVPSFFLLSDLLAGKFPIYQREAGREDENLQEEWGLIPEEVLDNMIGMHNKLFGSVDLVSHVSSLLIWMLCGNLYAFVLLSLLCFNFSPS